MPMVMSHGDVKTQKLRYFENNIFFKQKNSLTAHHGLLYGKK